MIQSELGLPVVEVEVPPVVDSMAVQLGNRLDALIETALRRRGRQEPPPRRQAT